MFWMAISIMGVSGLILSIRAIGDRSWIARLCAGSFWIGYLGFIADAVLWLLGF